MTVRFRQADVVWAIKAAQTAGMNVTRVRIAPDGAIELDFGAEAEKEAPAAPGDEWLVNDDALGSGIDTP